MPAIAKLVVALGASTANFETDMKRAARISDAQMRKMERQAKRLNDKWNRQFKLAGAAVATGLALATKAAIDFENAMAEVSTLLDDTSGLDQTKEAVKDLSVQFGQAPTQQAKALYQIISAGASDSASQMEQLTAANKLAVGGVTDVATAADGLTTVLNAYAGTGLDAEQVSDILFTTMRQGKTTIGELSQGIGNVATIAAQTKVPFDELGAAVGTLTKAGLSTNQAMDGLRGVLSAVLKQSDQSVKMAEELGVAFNATALESRGLHGFLQDIANTGATSEQLAKLFGRVEGLNAVMALGAQNGEEFTRQLENMEKVAGATDKAVDKMAETTKVKVDQAKAAFQTLGIEIGTKFLSSVSNMAVLVVKHIDDIAAAIEALVILLTVRLGIAGVRSLALMATSTGGLATAMAALGGPVGAITISLGALLLLIDRFYQKQLDQIETIPRLSGLLLKQADAFREVGDAAALAALSTEISAKYKELGKEVTRSTNAVIEGNKAYIEAVEAMGRNSRVALELKEKLEELEIHALNVRKLYRAYGEELEKVAEDTKESTKETEEQAEALAQVAKELEKARQAYAKMQAQRAFNQRIKESNKLIAEANQMMDELTREQEQYERQLESLIDTLFPAEAAAQAFADQIDLLNEAFLRGDISLARYSVAMQKVAEEMAKAQAAASKTGTEFSLLAVAMDEGIRILTRVGQDLWEGILSGSESVFDSIKDGFRSLLSNLANQASTQKIVIGIEQGIQQGFNQQNMRMIGEGIATFAAVILGAKLGGGGNAANTGAALGATAGAIVGSIIGGPIGTMAGTIIGGILGGLIGGLFDKKPRIGAGGFDIEPGDTKFFNTALGGVFVGDTKGGLDDYVDEFGQAIIEFDKVIGSVLSEDQLGTVGESLAQWSTEKKGDFATIEEILRSRFTAILESFDQNIKAFARKGQDLAEQIERFTVAVSAQNLLTEAPELFPDRTVNDILAVVSAMQTGIMTIGEAWNAFAELLTIVVSVRDALMDFAGSDLDEDFRAVMEAANMSLSEALAGMNSALMDAIVSFDGSPEQLQAIGAMVATIREGEIKLLSQIDEIQRGISANLETLKAEMLGVRDGPRTDEQLFKDAQGFINSISSATSAEEIAALERQFSAAIRAMSPEAQMSNMDSILQMIDAFQASSDTAIEGMKQAVMDSAKSTRDMVQEFIDRIGDPLDIIAGTNQEIRDALSGGDTVEADMQHEQNIEGILESGVNNISASVSSIGPVVAGALRNALGDVEINVTVQTGGGLTNE